jgi:methionyl-tRNA formyltransferase
MITKRDGRIDWRKSAEEIERMTRAYTPWPSAWTTLKQNGKELRIKILRARAISLSDIEMSKYQHIEHAFGEPGTIIKKKSDLPTGQAGLLIACGSGFLVVEQLHVAGGKPMIGKEFLAGYRKIQCFC